ncbi:hypothetical protein ACFQ1I_37770 [Kitasatospora arboriphila]
MSEVDRGPPAARPASSTHTLTCEPGPAELGTAACSVTVCPAGYVHVASAR